MHKSEAILSFLFDQVKSVEYLIIYTEMSLLIIILGIFNHPGEIVTCFPLIPLKSIL